MELWQTWADSGRNLLNLRPHPINLGPKSGRFRTTSGKSGRALSTSRHDRSNFDPKSAQIRPILAKFGPIRPQFSMPPKMWPKSVEIGVKAVEVGPIWSNSGQTLRVILVFDRSRPGAGQLVASSADSGPSLQKIDLHLQNSCGRRSGALIGQPEVKRWGIFNNEKVHLVATSML